MNASVFTVEDIYEIHQMIPALPDLISLSDCDFIEDAVTQTFDEIKGKKISDFDCIALRVLKRQSIKSTNLLQYYSVILKFRKSPVHLEIV